MNHTEKVIFGFFVLGFFLMVWGGFSLKPLTISPAQLDASVKQGRQKLDSSEPDVSQYTSVDYEREVETSSKVISPKALTLLEMNNSFRHPIAQPQIKRTQPPVLSLTALQSSSGVGFCPKVQSDSSFPSRSGGQNSGKSQFKPTPGVRWVVVTALIPNQEQEKRFTETFQNADVKYPDSDRPTYYSYYVEREEIDASGSHGWQPLDVKEAKDINTLYSGGAESEIVAQEFRVPEATQISFSKKPDQASSLPPTILMAMPLMDISKHQWGAESVHLPEIPIASNSQNDDHSEDDAYGADLSVHEIGLVSPKTVQFKLFRFIDTRVEGGKKYRYRFKLVLKNPNYNVKAEYVESEAITVNPFIESDWSQPSPVAEVPLDTRLYCIGSRAERSPQTQQSSPKLEDLTGPVGQLMILKFDIDKGKELSKNLNKENSKPGMVLNFYNSDFNSLSDDMFQESTRGVNFVTNDVVLDFFGKSKQTGSLFKGLPLPPARALIMSQDGQIFVLSEDKDKSTVFLKSNKPSLSTSNSSLGRGGQIDDAGRQPPRRNTRQQSMDDLNDGIMGH